MNGQIYQLDPECPALLRINDMIRAALVFDEEEYQKLLRDPEFTKAHREECVHCFHYSLVNSEP